MESEQGGLLLQMLAPAVEAEQPTTRKVLAAFPNDKGDFKPHEKSMSAIDLAWHIASSEIWFLTGIAEGEFSPGGPRPAEIKTIADVVAWYDKEHPAAWAAVKALPADKLGTPLNFHNVMNLPAVAYLGLMNSHSIHHRGQMSVYVRMAGGLVPSIYGGSADEPLKM